MVLITQVPYLVILSLRVVLDDRKSPAIQRTIVLEPVV